MNTRAFNPPPFVGYIEIGDAGGVQVHFYQKPNWLQRTMMRVLLGWKWFDL